MKLEDFVCKYVTDYDEQRDVWTKEIIIGTYEKALSFALDNKKLSWHTGKYTLTVSTLTYFKPYGWCMKWWKFIPVFGFRKVKKK